MADLNVRDFPLELLAEAKSVSTLQRMSLKGLVIQAVRDYCDRVVAEVAAPIKHVEQTVRDTHYEAID